MSTAPTAATIEPHTADVVARLLAQLAAGTGVDAELFTPDAALDATVPNWRFSVHGGDAVAAQFTSWFTFDQPGSFDELRRLPTPGGEVVELALQWTEHGTLHACHQSLIIDLDGGRIVRITLFCGGRWPAPLLAEMEAANMAAR
jgi:hypothetical protein